jgi:hypothetical protein
MQDAASGLLRRPLPGTWVNKRPECKALQTVVAADLGLVLGAYLMADAQRGGVLDDLLLGVDLDGPAGVVNRADVQGDDARSRAR